VINFRIKRSDQMPFCGECGKDYQAGSKFCNECGSPTQGGTPPPLPTDEPGEEQVLWQAKPAGLKAQLKDKANVNATEYTLTNQRIIIKSGLIGKKQDEVELVRIKDISMKQGLKDRAMGIGTVTVHSTDTSMPVLLLQDIREPEEVKEIIRKAMVKEREAKGMRYGERM